MNLDINSIKLIDNLEFPKFNEPKNIKRTVDETRFNKTFGYINPLYEINNLNLNNK